MNSIWIYQLLFSLTIIISISLAISKIFRIELTKSFFISICSISLFIALLYELNLYHLFLYSLALIAIIPFFFSNIRHQLLINKFIIFEFIFIILILHLFTYERILMDEDELYFWGVKYKYFIMQLSDGSPYTEIIKEPYKGQHGKIPALFQTFITSFVGFNEGGAILANNIILTSGFYFLFGNKIKNLFHKFLYYVIFYLIINNLSFGFLSIYLDPIVGVSFAIMVYYISNFFNYRDLRSVILLLIMIFFFINTHRISILFVSFLLILLSIKSPYRHKKKLSIIMGCIGAVLIVIFHIWFFNTYSNDVLRIYDNFIKFIGNFDIFVNTILFSKSYNSQFGVSYNAIANLLDIGLIKLPEYILHNFIWYFFCVFLMYVTWDQTKKINTFFIIIFFIFAPLISINKVYMNDTSPQVYGRYISFLLIPIILVNLAYIEKKFDKKNIYLLLSIIFFLTIITPKKTFGFFVTKNIYSNYDKWNKDYYSVREEYKKLLTKINQKFQNKTLKIAVIFKHNGFQYDRHPSLYQSAMELDFYPHHLTFIRAKSVMNSSFNIHHYTEKKHVWVFYNVEMNDYEIVHKLYNMKINEYPDTEIITFKTN